MAKKATAVKKGKQMTANTNWIQPPFDPRIYTMPFGVDKDNQLSTTLNRGKIQLAIRNPGVPGWNSVDFLYNPSQVNASYQLASTDQVTTQLYPQPGDTSQLRLPLNQMITFSLLFDRTYELWDSSKKSTSAGTYGVMVDVWAMQQLVGMNSDPSKLKGGDAKGLGTSNLMITSFCYFYFGGRSSLKYFGSIQSWDVTYTHWTQLMVPMRCAINVTAMLYPDDVVTDMLSANAKKAAKKTTAPDWSKIPTSNNGLPPGMSNTTANGIGGR